VPLFCLRQLFEDFGACRVLFRVGERAIQRNTVLFAEEIVCVAFEILCGWLHKTTVSKGKLHSSIQFHVRFRQCETLRQRHLFETESLLA